MKLICKVDRKQDVQGFMNFVAVVEVSPGHLVEAIVEAKGYSSEKYIEIEYDKVRMNPKTLLISCHDAHAARVLIGVEVCNFVRGLFPELAQLEYKNNRFVISEVA